MSTDRIKINRAPVMTLWAVMVAQRLGYSHDEALTLGKTVAGLNAQSKGQRLGIYEPGKEEPREEQEQARERKAGEVFMVDLLGREVPSVRTDDGVRALSKDQPVDPRSVQRYLDKKFGEDLPRVEAAMRSLAESFPEDELSKKAYSLYEKFRPQIPEGTRGWGAEGELDLEKIASLAKS